MFLSCFHKSLFLEEQRKREKEERDLQKKKEREDKGMLCYVLFWKQLFNN